MQKPHFSSFWLLPQQDLQTALAGPRLPRPSARGHPPPPAALVNSSAGAGTQACRDGAKEVKLPSTGPLKIITAFSKADFARCQGKNCLSRHLSVLVKKQKACQGRAGPGHRTERAFFAVLDEAQCFNESSY